MGKLLVKKKSQLLMPCSQLGHSCLEYSYGDCD